jgi:hypothetical protein
MAQFEEREPKPLTTEQLKVKAWRKEKKGADFYKAYLYPLQSTSIDPSFLAVQVHAHA